MSDTLSTRLKMLRQALESAGLDAWIVPSTDPHQSEYLSPHWQTRAWFSGFTGSAGTLVVTRDRAALWTDSRYYLQAEQELPSEIQLMRSQEADVPSPWKWLGKTLASGAKVGMSGWLMTVREYRQRSMELASMGLKLAMGEDVAASAWENRPALPCMPVRDHSVALAGASRSDKLDRLRSLMQEKGGEHLLLSTLDDIAWTLNLRGSDVPFNPVFLAYLIVHQQGATLFVDARQVEASLAQSLAQAGVALRGYDEILAHIAGLSGKVLADEGLLSCKLHAAFGKEAPITHLPCPTIPMKAVKNAVELGHLRRTMEKDGVALLRLFRWLETAVAQGVTEAEVGAQLARFRAAQPGYATESFTAIVGYAGNGAIVHYHPDPEHSATLRPEGMLLLDSGGQYEDGTTDVTRTITLGTPTPAQRLHYTLVLRGHLALSAAQFPEGTAGYQLDVLARAPLWQQGLDYGHGTGHGVGFFLCVHEGPQSIRNGHSERSAVVMQPGMVTSNEPGYYRTGEYGIRIENLIACREGDTPGFLAFETLTLFPYDRRLIDVALLSTAERAWVDSYHREVQSRLGQYLDAEERAWLSAWCAPL